MLKPDCYKCVYRGNIPRDCHSCCNHPSIKTQKSNPLLNIMATFASVERAPSPLIDSGELNIRGNPHGVVNSWFVWPINFDPIWLENCDGFEPIQE